MNCHFDRSAAFYCRLCRVPQARRVRLRLGFSPLGLWVPQVPVLQLGLGFLLSPGCPRFGLLPGSWVSLLRDLCALRVLCGEYSSTPPRPLRSRRLPRPGRGSPSVPSVVILVFSSDFQLSTFSFQPTLHTLLPSPPSSMLKTNSHAQETPSPPRPDVRHLRRRHRSSSGHCQRQLSTQTHQPHHASSSQSTPRRNPPHRRRRPRHRRPNLPTKFPPRPRSSPKPP